MVTELPNILKETRSHILSCLKSAGRMTVGEMARNLGVSKVCIRRHLELLKQDGLVEFTVAKRERGRPFHLYSLTEKSRHLFSSGSISFTLDLLRQVGAIYGQKGVYRVLRGQADELISSLKRDLDLLDFDERVERLFALMNDRGFDITLERLGNGSYKVRQSNCPLFAVASSYEQVCDQEIRIYKELLGVEIVRDCRIAAGASSCNYRIMPPEISRPPVVLLTRKGADRVSNL